MSAVPKKNKEPVKTVENLMTQITKDLNAEAARTEEPAKKEENPRNSVSFQNEW